jgi:hypothetical protein
MLDKIILKMLYELTSACQSVQTTEYISTVWAQIKIEQKAYLPQTYLYHTHPNTAVSKHHPSSK